MFVFVKLWSDIQVGIKIKTKKGGFQTPLHTMTVSNDWNHY